LVTHPTSNVILPGITRDYVLELARELEIHVEERPIQIEELWQAEEAFFTGTTTEVRPTVKVDGRTIGKGRPGPVTRLLFEAFLEGVARPAATAGAR
jgi:D-alanine transaminase